MNTRSHEQKPTQNAKAVRSSKCGQAFARQSLEPDSFQVLQRMIGNQAVQRLLQSNSHTVGENFTNAVLSPLGQAISKESVYKKTPTSLQDKLNIQPSENQYKLGGGEDKLHMKQEAGTPVFQRQPIPGTGPVGANPLRKPAKSCRYTIQWSNPKKISCNKLWKAKRSSPPPGPLCGKAILLTLHSVSASSSGCLSKIVGMKITEQLTSNKNCVPKNYVWPLAKPCVIGAGGKLTNCTDLIALCGLTSALRGSCKEIVNQRVLVGGKLAETHTITFTLTKKGNSCTGKVTRT